MHSWNDSCEPLHYCIFALFDINLKSYGRVYHLKAICQIVGMVQLKYIYKRFAQEISMLLRFAYPCNHFNMH